VKYADLPLEYKRVLTFPRLSELGEWPRLKQAEGKWPNFALICTELAQRETKRPLRPLGASRPKEFTTQVQLYLVNQLMPELTKEEAKQLTATEGKWPEYPLLLLDLAYRHRRVIPGMSLPGPRSLWDRVSVARLPERRNRAPFDVAHHQPGDAGRDRFRPVLAKKKPPEPQRSRYLDHPTMRASAGR
jgi:hypothetical protein